MMTRVMWMLACVMAFGCVDESSDEPAAAMTTWGVDEGMVVSEEGSDSVMPPPDEEAVLVGPGDEGFVWPADGCYDELPADHGRLISGAYHRFALYSARYCWWQGNPPPGSPDYELILTFSRDELAPAIDVRLRMEDDSDKVVHRGTTGADFQGANLSTHRVDVTDVVRQTSFFQVYVEAIDDDRCEDCYITVSNPFLFL